MDASYFHFRPETDEPPLDFRNHFRAVSVGVIARDNTIVRAATALCGPDNTFSRARGLQIVKSRLTLPDRAPRRGLHKEDGDSWVYVFTSEGDERDDAIYAAQQALHNGWEQFLEYKRARLAEDARKLIRKHSVLFDLQEQEQSHSVPMAPDSFLQAVRQ